ncbi:hypothetical protein, partial [Actinotalea sp.]|uniref:hypothetical protein n=1 Tax=Actinotalea sp. TaxID=1872145 RepID=UPI003569E520
DLGQVVFVFTALIVQMSILEQRRAREAILVGASDGSSTAPGPTAHGSAAPSSAPHGSAAHGSADSRRLVLPWRDIASARVLWAIAGGLTLSVLTPGLARTLAGPDGFTAVVFDTVGGLTTPLVCLVIGASLAAGIPRDPAIVTVVALRTAVGLGLGLLVGLVLVPALGFSPWYSRAAILLFVLPAPFVIPVYYKRSAALVGSVLTLSTAVSIVLIAVLAMLDLV